MFFGAERLIEMRRFILASDHEARIGALEKIKTYQVEDFEAIFRLSQDRPTIVRLLDPPLHEFCQAQMKTSQALPNNLIFLKMYYVSVSLNSTKLILC